MRRLPVSKARDPGADPDPIPPTETGPRLYAVMTDSRRDGTAHLARVKPPASKENGFWTADDAEKVWLMSLEDAISVRNRLSRNNPRIVRAKKALEIIRGQAARPGTDQEEPESPTP
jgi:hypothetical protein